MDADRTLEVVEMKMLLNHPCPISAMEIKEPWHVDAKVTLSGGVVKQGKGELLAHVFDRRSVTIENFVLRQKQELIRMQTLVDNNGAKGRKGIRNSDLPEGCTEKDIKVTKDSSSGASKRTLIQWAEPHSVEKAASVSGGRCKCVGCRHYREVFRQMQPITRSDFDENEAAFIKMARIATLGAKEAKHCWVQVSLHH